MSDMMKTNTPEEIMRKFSRELPVTLNEHELQVYGKMLAEKCKEQELAIEKKKTVVAEHANRIKVITNEIKRIADARAKGEELRPVMCGERLNGNVIEIVRLDRYEVVDTRPADLRDLQTTLPGVDPGVPAMPDGFDEGPRGEQLGTLADQPVEDDGEIVTSSVGDQVYIGEAVETETETETESPALVDVDELTDEEIDRRLNEREQSIAEDEQAKKKPARERSKKANDAKAPKASPKKKK